MSDASVDRDLPKQDLLLKFLRMTTSPNDGEALVACRKANALLVSAGWDWEKLLRGKITVVEDPFSKIATPPEAASRPPPESMQPPARPTQPPPPPSRPVPTYSRPQPRAQRPPPAATPPPMPNAPWPTTKKAAPSAPPSKPAPTNYSLKSNRYEGYCYCCGTLVGQQGGFIFEPNKHNPAAPYGKFQIICAPCNQGAVIPVSPSPRQKVNYNASPTQL